MLTKKFFMTVMILFMSISITRCGGTSNDNTPPSWKDVEQQVEAARQSLLDVGSVDDPYSQSKFLRFVKSFRAEHNEEPLLVITKLENNTNFAINTVQAFDIIKKAMSESDIVYVELPYVNLADFANSDPSLYQRIRVEVDKKQLKQRKPSLVLLSSIEQYTRHPSADEASFTLQRKPKDDGRLRSTISLKMKVVDVQNHTVSPSGDLRAETLWEFDSPIKILDGGLELLLGNLVKISPSVLYDTNVERFHHARNALGLIVADMTLENESYDKEISYKFTWYNEKGHVVLPDSFASKENALTIRENTSENIRGVAPRPDAVSFQLTISEKNS